ncbi:hypothetical protein LSAT2_002048, partial [Lamellibrachia satsuma]
MISQLNAMVTLRSGTYRMKDNMTPVTLETDAMTSVTLETDAMTYVTGSTSSTHVAEIVVAANTDVHCPPGHWSNTPNTQP